jgi:membrane-associated phospholipid phosphatase
MKNNVKETEPVKVVQIPELEIHGFWARSVERVRKIPRTFWLIAIAAAFILILIFTPVSFWEVIWLGILSKSVIAVLLLVFGLVGVSLIWGTGQKIDVWVLMYFNMRGRRAPWLDWVMLALTQIGSGLFALGLVVFLFFFVSRTLAYEITLGASTLWLIVECLKFLFHRTRPYLKLPKIRIIGSRAGGRSFPSGHTSQSFFLATILISYFKPGIPLALVFSAGAMIIGITRIYVGMHYPRDVIAGAILGVSWGLLGAIVNAYIFGPIS